MRQAFFAVAVVSAFMLSGPALAADLADKSAPIDDAPEAVPSVSGYLGIFGGASVPSTSGDINCCKPHDTVFAFGATGAVNFWLGQMLGLQFSAHGEGTTDYSLDVGGGGRKEDRMGGVIGSHLAWRDPSSHALGVFAAITSSNNWYIDTTHTGMLGGVEAQKYIGATTLYGQLGYGGQFDDSDGGFMIDDYWFARGVVRHFLNPNLRISGEVSYASGEDYTSHGDIDIWGWGAGVERRFDSSPFSIFGEYSGDLMSSSRGDITQHTFLAGAKLNFGEPTLLDNDRNGATFDLPKFYRAMPGSCWAVSC